ncbi:MAG: hypothetical protein Q4A79_01475 [Candidatus Saccharibacteria bacterium]|nr:hypothetical protein [Candidatus Saccharibacteria bacterium]
MLILASGTFLQQKIVLYFYEGFNRDLQEEKGQKSDLYTVWWAMRGQWIR